MPDCWPLVVPCLFAEGLSAALREAAGDLGVVLRQLGIDRTLLGDAGWVVAGVLYLRLRLERLQRQRSRSVPAAAVAATAPPPGGPDPGAD
jgi:hypothetical protein